MTKILGNFKENLRKAFGVEDVVNKVELKGKIHKIHFFYDNNQDAVMEFQLKVQDEDIEPDIIPCLTFVEMAEKLNNYVKEGDTLKLIGKWCSHIHEDDGQEKAYSVCLPLHIEVFRSIEEQSKEKKIRRGDDLSIR